MTTTDTTTDTTTHPTPAGPDAPPVVTGINHVGLVTADLDRLAAFYVAVFDAEVLDVPAPPGTRAVVVQLADRAGLAVMELPTSAHVRGSSRMLDRGHLDHLAVDVPDGRSLEAVRRRLVAQGASDGAVSDYGPMLSIYFTDPDGMAAEACWVRDPSYAGFHAPEPFTGDLAALDGTR